MKMGIEVVNDKEIIGKFNKLRDTLQEDVDKGILKGGEIVAVEAKARVHILTGATQASIFTKLVSSGLTKVSATTPYAEALESKYPFLSPSLSDKKDAVNKAVKEEVVSSIGKVFTKVL